MIAVCRPPIRRRADGLSKRDVLRCLKRFIAREVFNALKLDLLEK
jgi:transposase